MSSQQLEVEEWLGGGWDSFISQNPSVRENLYSIPILLQ